MKTTIELLKERIAALEAEVERLKAMPKQEFHYHHHYDAPRYAPAYQPLYPNWPTITCGSGGDIVGQWSIGQYQAQG